MTTVLGIDPGSIITGYGIVRYLERQINYLGSGCIHTKAQDFSSRLQLIYTGITDVISKFHPDCFSIEKVFVSKNADSALKLSQARGAAILAALNQNLPVFEYAARQVKKTVVGVGKAKKRQVQYMVRILLKLQADPKKDAADALAIAITHCYISQNNILNKKSYFNLL